MSRPDRWWRPTSRRPAVRARSRVYRYNEYDVNMAYDRGIMRGTRDTVQRREDRDLIERAQLNDPERMRQLAEACELPGEEGKREIERLAREWGVFPDGDDLLDVADAAGVLDGDEDQALWDSVEPADDGEGIVVEIEQWLRERGRGE